MSIKIENLTKTFGDKNIIRNFSYDFPKAGVIALVGESGTGKTTLLRIIAGLDKKFEGVISGNETVSVAFQEYRLFPELTVLENVIFAISETKSEAVCERCKEMLLFMGFTEKELQLYPNELSGGMKQRVSLCRAFLRDAPILLLDEPTKELDTNNVIKVLDIIRQNASRRLVIIATHNKSDIDNLSAPILQISKQ